MDDEQGAPPLSSERPEASVEQIEKRDEEREQEQKEKQFHVIDRRVSQLKEEDLEALDALGEEHGSAPTYIEKLEQQLARAQERLKELQAELRSELATEVETTRRRLEREAAQQAQRVRVELAAPMLEVLEALDRSLQVGAQGSREVVLEGVERVHQLMIKKLGELGLERIVTVGERFDPTRHEAIGLIAVTDPAQDGVVLAEVSPGFAMAGQIMRAPRVQVGRLQA